MTCQVLTRITYLMGNSLNGTPKQNYMLSILFNVMISDGHATMLYSTQYLMVYEAHYLLVIIAAVLLYVVQYLRC